MNLNNFTTTLIKEAFDLSDKKGEDYRVGSEYVHQNFINVGEVFDIHPSLVLGIYLKKHLDAIRNYVRTEGESESEPIRERAKDVINYLMLAIPLVDDKHLTVHQFDVFRNHTLETIEMGIDAEPKIGPYEAEERLIETFSEAEKALADKNLEELIKFTGGVVSLLGIILYYEQE